MLRPTRTRTASRNSCPNQTSLLPGDSASKSQGANGLPTAKLSPISGNAAGAVSKLPAPVLDADHDHPYSSMSAEDCNAEPDGLIGLTVQPGYVDGEAVTNPHGGKRARVQRLFTSTVSGPTRTFADANDSDLIGFCKCHCTWCSERLNSVISRDQDSAKRKPIPPGGGSRDVLDVPTLTDVPTRPPMYDAI